MVLLTRHLVTEAEFDRFVAQPENADRNFEFINGEIIEVVSSNYSSTIAMRIMGRVGVFADDHKLGHVTGADGGYMVAGNKYIPDGAFISFQRQPEASHAAYNPLPPDLAIEVLSPGNEDVDIARKVANYLSDGTVVWVVDPEGHTIDVFVPGQPSKTLRDGDILEGGEVLTGFRLAVSSIWG